MSFTYEYPRPALTVDCVVLGVDEENLKVLLIQRDLDPFEGRWALPGGFVHVDEPLEEAARRELEEETGLRQPFLEQLFTFGFGLFPVIFLLLALDKQDTGIPAVRPGYQGIETIIFAVSMFHEEGNLAMMLKGSDATR